MHAQIAAVHPAVAAAMRHVVADTGSLVAFLDRSDRRLLNGNRLRIREK
jgi:hypothetical protein